MAKVVEQRFFSQFNAAGRNNKFWNITLYEDGAVEVHFGPQGKAGQKKMYSSGEKKGGRAGFESQIRDKTGPSHHGGPYVENKVLEAVQTTVTSAKVTNASELKAKAVRDIIKDNSNPELTKLIHYFAEVNAHNIMEASGGKITYDTSSGSFRTTQGVVTLHQIQEARTLLNNIDNFAARPDFSKLVDAKGTGAQSRELFESLNMYLSLIPQAGLVRQMDLAAMFSVSHGLRKQNDILDGLEASYATVLANANKDNGKKTPEVEAALFKVDLTPADDAEFQRVKVLYNRTKGSHWDVQSYDVRRVFHLNIHFMTDGFETHGRKVGNVKELWHGTGAANMLSILKAGMIIPRSGGSIHVTGRMFGDGLYFSDQSTKAIRYATGAWGGGGSRDRKFMFLNDVAMGKEYIPRSSFSGKIPVGFDSCFAKAGHSGVQNNEMIVYKVTQACPKRIVEFTNGGK